MAVLDWRMAGISATPAAARRALAAVLLVSASVLARPASALDRVLSLGGVPLKPSRGADQLCKDVATSTDAAYMAQLLQWAASLTAYAPQRLKSAQDAFNAALKEFSAKQADVMAAQAELDNLDAIQAAEIASSADETDLRNRLADFAKGVQDLDVEIAAKAEAMDKLPPGSPAWTAADAEINKLRTRRTQLAAGSTFVLGQLDELAAEHRGQLGDRRILVKDHLTAVSVPADQAAKALGNALQKLDQAIYYEERVKLEAAALRGCIQKRLTQFQMPQAPPAVTPPAAPAAPGEALGTAEGKWSLACESQTAPKLSLGGRIQVLSDRVAGHVHLAWQAEPELQPGSASALDRHPELLVLLGGELIGTDSVILAPSVKLDRMTTIEVASGSFRVGIHLEGDVNWAQKPRGFYFERGNGILAIGVQGDKDGYSCWGNWNAAPAACTATFANGLAPPECQR